MSGPKRDIAEHEVCTLRSQVGDWPAGTEGTAVGIYVDEVLLELSGLPMEEALDNLIFVPVDKLEVIWRDGDPFLQGHGSLMEASSAVTASSNDLQP